MQEGLYRESLLFGLNVNDEVSRAWTDVIYLHHDPGDREVYLAIKLLFMGYPCDNIH